MIIMEQKKVIFKLKQNHLFIETEDVLLKNMLQKNDFIDKDLLNDNLFKFNVSIDDEINFQKVFEPVKTIIEVFNFKEVYETDFFIKVKTDYCFSHLFN